MTKEQIQISNKHIKRFSRLTNRKMQMKIMNIFLPIIILAKITLRLDSSWSFFRLSHGIFSIDQSGHRTICFLALRLCLYILGRLANFSHRKLSIQQWLDSWIQVFLLFIIYTLSSQFLERVTMLICRYE